MTTWEYEGRIWRYYAPEPRSLISAFWWADTTDGGLMAFCVGEILSWSVDNDRLATNIIWDKGDENGTSNR